MCFAFDAHPPDLPADLALPTLAGGAAAEPLELTSADGTRFSAALAEAPEAVGPGRRRPARRPRPLPLLRRAGRALRAGRPPRDRDRLLRPHGGHRRARQRLRLHAARDCRRASSRSRPTRRGDRRAARAHRRELDRHRRVLLRRHAVVHGGHQRRARPRWGRRLLRRASCPRREGAPGADRARRPRPAARCSASSAAPTRTSSPEHIEAYERGLQEAGVEHEIVTYPGAPHSFFDRSFSEHAEACEDAWRRVLGFLQRVGTPLAR